MTNNDIMANHGTLQIQDTWIIDLVVERKYRLLRHITLFAVFFIIIFFSDWLAGYSGFDKYYRFFCVYSIFLSLFYINIYILLPTLFFKGKYLLYLIILIVLVTSGLELSTYVLAFLKISDPGATSNGHKSIFEATVIAFPIILITTTIKLLQRWVIDNQRIAELKDLTQSMELNELRNQINPHFLFNMLNGIKALVRTDPEKATSVIMKLSEFLRYQLYENNEEKTMLGNELKFLSNFLSLETLRRDNLSTDIHCIPDIKKLNSVMLPPNLFTTFVENALKHSVNVTGAGSYINIAIVLEGKQLVFTCENSIDARYIQSDKHSGLGLANIKRRLELLYGENHVLTIVSEPETYAVKMILTL